MVDGSDFEELAPTCKDFRKAFINAHILEQSGADVSRNEDCLSVPGIHEDVVRKDKIRIAFTDEQGVQHEEEYEGTKAWVIQHEYDPWKGLSLPTTSQD